MSSPYYVIDHIYHCLQHIKSDLDNISDDRIKSIEHTVNHALNAIEKYLDEK